MNNRSFDSTLSFGCGPDHELPFSLTPVTRNHSITDFHLIPVPDLVPQPFCSESSNDCDYYDVYVSLDMALNPYGSMEGRVSFEQAKELRTTTV